MHQMLSYQPIRHFPATPATPSPRHLHQERRRELRPGRKLWHDLFHVAGKRGLISLFVRPDPHRRRICRVSLVLRCVSNNVPMFGVAVADRHLVDVAGLLIADYGFA
jgi:hypothetical protein